MFRLLFWIVAIAFLWQLVDCLVHDDFKEEEDADV